MKTVSLSLEEIYSLANKTLIFNGWQIYEILLDKKTLLKQIKLGFYDA